MSTSTEYINNISNELKTYNTNAVNEICNNLINSLFESDETFDLKDAGKIMQLLRGKRMFALMQKVGDALIQTGRVTSKIKRLYAQALIDQNMYTAAIAVLNELDKETSVTADNAEIIFENSEAKGILGRVYKQLYVNAKSPKASHSVNYIKKAIEHYLGVYNGQPGRTWHGINAVALIKRAERDGIVITGFPPAYQLATSVLQTITEKLDEQTADAWDFATAAEACVALEEPEKALEWLSGYARMPYCDAFELASTLRQLQEVWQLDMTSEMGRLLLPILRAELMKREGGGFTINPSEVNLQKTDEQKTSDKYNSLVAETKSNPSGIVLEKVFGADSFKTYKWYIQGVERCQAVARIGTDSTKGFGTGFLLKGSLMHESLGEELIMITNAHVVSNDPADQALKPEVAIVIFETLNRDEEFRVSEIIWSSPRNNLDVTLLRFHNEDHDRLGQLTKGVTIYPVSKYLPTPDPIDAQKIYIIGHPFGGTLQLSFQDNVLLDHESPKIHYRTPTAGGSSGSPVFNQQWDLIGLHHAGGAEMDCLNGKPGKYEANEGMWIQAIKDALQKFLTKV